MVRILASIVAGTLVAFAVIWLVEFAGHAAWPVASDLDMHDPEAVARALPAIPLAAKLVIMLAWFAGALAGGALAKWVAGSWWAAWPIAGLVALAGIMTVMMMPHPVWMQVAAVAAPLLGGLGASHLVGPARTRQGAIDADL